MSHVTSKDGTRIAHDRAGSGPALILVGGGLDDGAENAPLATELARSFTVFNYARRGRGDSGDTPPYALEREIDDLDALVAEAGGSAHAYGVSSGGALALEAAAAGVALDRIVAYDAACLGDGLPQVSVTQPVLVATGGGAAFFELAGDALAASLPNAERRVIPRQSHVADPRAVAPVLGRFLRR